MAARRTRGTGSATAAWMAVALSLTTAPPPAAAQEPRPSCGATATLVARAGAHVTSADESFDGLVAAEDYRQQIVDSAGPGAALLPPISIREDIQVQPPSTAASRVRATRRVRASFLFVRQGDDRWLGFRDVIQVDGRAVGAADRPWPGQSVVDASALDAWRRASEEGERFALGPIARTLNVATGALLVLHPTHAGRFRFTSEPGAGRGTCEVTFQELSSPTIVRTGIDDDVPASGAFHIEAGSGRVVGSELIGGSSLAAVASRTSVRYELDPGLRLWVPREMREEFLARGGVRVRTVARYSDFRRVEVATIIRPAARPDPQPSAHASW
jgi:hypothetical protein